jgi:sulfur transfer protein SufE
VILCCEGIFDFHSTEDSKIVQGRLLLTAEAIKGDTTEEGTYEQGELSKESLM